jgi:hypothetical protein
MSHTFAAARSFAVHAIQPLVDCFRARFVSNSQPLPTQQTQSQSRLVANSAGNILGSAAASTGATLRPPNALRSSLDLTAASPSRHDKTNIADAQPEVPVAFAASIADVESQLLPASQPSSSHAAAIVDTFVRSVGQVPQTRYAPLRSVSDDEASASLSGTAAGL